MISENENYKNKYLAFLEVLEFPNKDRMVELNIKDTILYARLIKKYIEKIQKHDPNAKKYKLSKRIISKLLKRNK